MPVPPRTPVLVGAAQLSQRAEDPALAREPIVLMRDALRLAAEDAGAPGLLARADSICVTQGTRWRTTPAGLHAPYSRCARRTTSAAGRAAASPP
jgi:acetyl-CoA C-acetyltransferase